MNPPRRASPDLFAPMREEIARRMHEAADRILREDWPGYGPLAGRGTPGELEQVVRDAADTAKLNHPDLLAEYLEVIAAELVEIPRARSRPIAERLTAKRREIELAALENLDLSAAMPQRDFGLRWSPVTRVAVGVLMAFFALLAIAFALPTAPSAAERFTPSLVLLAIDVFMGLVFFGGRYLQVKPPQEMVKTHIRKEIEERFATPRPSR